MEQSDENLNRAIAQMERQLTTCRDSTSCNLPMGVLLTLALALRNTRDAHRATVRMTAQEERRLTGEIAERSQRQLEITGRLAALERRMSMREVVVDPDRMALGLTEFFRDAARTDDTGPDKASSQAAAEIERDKDYTDELTEALGYMPGSLTWQRAIELVHVNLKRLEKLRFGPATSNRVRMLEERNETQAGTITELERELANARADAQVHQGARQALETWEAEFRESLGVGPGESRGWMVGEVARLRRDVATYRQRWETQGDMIVRYRARSRDLEAQVHALDHAIADVWALVEQTDGYGSPFWTEPGLDDATPAQAVAAVLSWLRMRDDHFQARRPAIREAMAALNAADRQSDDDQVCGC